MDADGLVLQNQDINSYNAEQQCWTPDYSSVFPVVNGLMHQLTFELSKQNLQAKLQVRQDRRWERWSYILLIISMVLCSAESHNNSVIFFPKFIRCDLNFYTFCHCWLWPIRWNPFTEIGEVSWKPYKLSHLAHMFFNLLRRSDVYASLKLPSLVQIMACCLVSAKPLSELVLEYS